MPFILCQWLTAGCLIGVTPGKRTEGMPAPLGFLVQSTHSCCTRLAAIWTTHLPKRGVENVLFGSITLYWKNNGVLLECFPRECFHELLVYFKLEIGARVMVAVGG